MLIVSFFKKNIATKSNPATLRATLQPFIFKFIPNKAPEVNLSEIDEKLYKAKQILQKIRPKQLQKINDFFENIISRKNVYQRSVTNRKINEGIVHIANLLEIKGVLDDQLIGLLENVLNKDTCDPARLNAVNVVISYLHRQNLSSIELKLATEYDGRYNDLKENVKAEINKLFPGVYDSQDSHQDSMVDKVLNKLLGNGEFTPDVYMPVTTVQELVIKKIIENNELYKQLSASSLTDENFDEIFLQGESIQRLSDFFTSDFIKFLTKQKDFSFDHTLIRDLQEIAQNKGLDVSHNNLLFNYDDEMSITTYTPLFKTLYLTYLTQKKQSLFQKPKCQNTNPSNIKIKQITALTLFKLIQNETKRLRYSNMQSILHDNEDHFFGKHGFRLSKVLLAKIHHSDLTTFINDIQIDVNENIRSIMPIFTFIEENFTFPNSSNILKSIYDEVSDPSSTRRGLNRLNLLLNFHSSSNRKLESKIHQCVQVINARIQDKPILDLEFDTHNPTYQFNFISMLMKGNPLAYEKLLGNKDGFNFLLNQSKKMKVYLNHHSNKSNNQELRETFSKLRKDLHEVYLRIALHKNIPSKIIKYFKKHNVDPSTHSSYEQIKNVIMKHAKIDELVEFLKLLPVHECKKELSNILEFDNYYIGSSARPFQSISYHEKQYLLSQLNLTHRFYCGSDYTNPSKNNLHMIPVVY